MRTFRFPRFVIFLMIACFITVSGAIALAREMARRLEMSRYAQVPNVLALLWDQIPAIVVTGFVTACLFGAIGYGLLSALGGTGVNRLAKLDTHSPRARH